jgi:hypothetical protein
VTPAGICHNMSENKAIVCHAQSLFQIILLWHMALVLCPNAPILCSAAPVLYLLCLLFRTHLNSTFIWLVAFKCAYFGGLVCLCHYQTEWHINTLSHAIWYPCHTFPRSAGDGFALPDYDILFTKVQWNRRKWLNPWDLQYALTLTLSVNFWH